MKPIRTKEDRDNTLSNIARLRQLASEKGYKFGTQYDDAEERLEDLKQQEDETASK